MTNRHPHSLFQEKIGRYDVLLGDGLNESSRQNDGVVLR
jgi:hypothetical protein